MKKINLWPLFFGSIIVIPFVIQHSKNNGWVLTVSWSVLCLLICVGYEIYYKIKHK